MSNNVAAVSANSPKISLGLWLKNFLNKPIVRAGVNTLLDLFLVIFTAVTKEWNATRWSILIGAAILDFFGDTMVCCSNFKFTCYSRVSTE